ncbi:MAG: energy-coupling factor ABC transporter permease [bacterium]|nr:energy-coupling factor ABC transporter permease [bacterium]MDW8163609.1 energy-coupling factor ABC transporter permease [Candidatus Omnitrophota bacterium]
MHIPDGFLNTEVLVTTGAISLASLSYSIKKLNQNIDPQRVPLMGVSASFVFVVQLLSFPVVAGTSAHLNCAVLISILLGPFSGLVIVASSLILHAILFQHGGILTLGANILNIGITGCFLGFLIYKILKSSITGAFFASFFATIFSAILCAYELSLSGRTPINVAIVSMGGVHILIGAIEGFATVFILSIIKKIRPDLLELKKI